MDNSYPAEVLRDYGRAVEGISRIDTIAEEVSAVLYIIEHAADGEKHGELIAAFAAAARLLLAKVEDATNDISEYCRAADVAFERAGMASEGAAGQ